MNRREFLRLSFGALVASKLPALPAHAQGSWITFEKACARWGASPVQAVYEAWWYKHRALLRMWEGLGRWGR